MTAAAAHTTFPIPLEDYPIVEGGLLATLQSRIELSPFNAVVTGIFALAIVHTFLAAQVSAWAHRVQHRHDEARRHRGLAAQPSLTAELLHFFGEVEVIFGLWAIVLFVAIVAHMGLADHHALLQRHGQLHRAAVCRRDHGAGLDATGRRVCRSGAGPRRRPGSGARPAAWWLSILTIGPVLGSFITEPAAMTICALLLGRQFYDLQPSDAR